MSVRTAQVHLFLITSRGCLIVHGSTRTQTFEFTLVERAARCLMFLQMGMFKWVSRYCKTQSSLFLCSESICQCLGYLPFFSFSSRGALLSAHALSCIQASTADSDDAISHYIQLFLVTTFHGLLCREQRPFLVPWIKFRD